MAPSSLPRNGETMRQLLSIVMFAALFVTVSTAQDVVMNKDCPFMSKPSKKEFFVDTPKGRVYLCCKGCIKKASADLEATYAKAYPETKKVGNTNCPVSDSKLEGKGTTVVFKGHEVNVCCKDCGKKFADKGDEYLKKATEKPAKKDDKPADKPKSDG